MSNEEGSYKNMILIIGFYVIFGLIFYIAVKFMFTLAVILFLLIIIPLIIRSL